MVASYFSFLPGVLYRGKATPNITLRMQVSSAIDNQNILFHKYQIEDGDRPDTIAYLYYGASEYDWLIPLANKSTIRSMQTDWPLTQRQLDLTIAKKYGSLTNSYTRVIHYVVNTNIPSISQVAFNALGVNQKKYWNVVTAVSGTQTYSIGDSGITLSPESYASLSIDEKAYWTPVNAYDYEFESNEAKRNIRLIDSQYVQQLERALRVASNV